MAGTFLVTDASNTQVIGTLSFTNGGASAVFTETAPLQNLMKYSVSVLKDCKSADEIPLAADFLFSFTTKAAVVIPAPTVVSTVPVDGATDVDPTQPITVNFSVPMDITTITTS